MGSFLGIRKDMGRRPQGMDVTSQYHEGDLEGGLIYWGIQKMRFLRDMQNVL
jgi:hypothetical protein